MIKLHFFDLFIVIAYLAICLGIGLYSATKIKTVKQFALGNKGVSSAVLACIIFASTVGAGSTMGIVERSYTLGIILTIAILVQPLCWFIAAKIFAPNISHFEGCISISEIMHKLYGLPGRWVTNIASVVLGIGVVAAQASAIGYVFHYFLGIETIYGMLISYGILVLYSALGGIRSIIFSEVFKFSVFFFIIPASYVIAFTNTDGLSTIIQKIPTHHWGFDFTNENLLLFISLALYSLIPSCDSVFIQRCLMASDSEKLKSSFKTLAFICIAFSLSMFIIASIVQIHSPNVAPQEAFLYYIANYLPIGVRGIMVAGIMAIIMGNAEAWLNATSVIVVNDIFKILYPRITQKKQLIALRILVITLAVFSILIALLGHGILDLIWLVDSFSVPLVLIPLSAGFLGFRTTRNPFIASTIAAMIFTLLGRFVVGKFALISLILGIIGSAIGLFGMHYWQTIKRKIRTRISVEKLRLWFLTQTRKSKKIAAIPAKIINNLKKQIQNNVHQQPGSYKKFVSFTLIYYFIYTLNLVSSPAHKVLSYLLIIGYLLCFILLLKDAFFSKEFQKKYLSLYWYCTLTFCLPLVSSYMLFVGQGDEFWLVNGLLAVFSLYFFVDALRFLILLSVGVIYGYTLFMFSGLEQGLSHAKTINVSTMGYIYLFFLFTSLLLLRGREKEQEEKIETMQILGGAIAHEVKTPISAMSMCAQAISDVLSPTLNATKNLRNSREEYIVTFDKNTYEFLIQINKSLQKLSSQGINVVDSILMSLRNSVIGDEKKLHSINECIQKALDEYSAFNENVKDIEVNIDNNFNTLCSLHYLKHVIFNLLKNTYKYAGPNVKIEIWTSNNKLHFKDYGKGIHSKDLPHIFDKFYTKSESGTGIGLAFCKMVMEDLNGSIECKSELGKYTEFVLTFPKLTIVKKYKSLS